MSKQLTDAVRDRRSFYAIGKGPVIPDEKLRRLIGHAVKYAPSPFNSQSARLLVLLGKEHDRLWSLTEDALREVVPADQFVPTKEKIDAFRGGHGTILYFEDQEPVRALQEKFPLYKDNFPVWSLEASGMLQFSIWTILESEGYGASLQHYNPLIDKRVAGAWDVPAAWKLLAEMPFGKPLARPDAKSFLPLENRVRFSG